MGKCSRCGKKGLFLKIDNRGHCSRCADELHREFFSKLTFEPVAKPSSAPLPQKKTAAIANNNSYSDPNNEKKILVYDLSESDIDKVLSLIRDNHGILQRDLGKNFEMPYRAAVRELLYHMEQQSLIYRSKEKNTYHLFLNGNPSSKSFKMPPRPVVKTPEERYKESQAWQRKQLADYRRAGIKKVKWSCGRLNGRECPDCLAKNGKVYWIDKHPRCPAHVGCTCALVGVVELPGENVPVTEY